SDVVRWTGTGTGPGPSLSGHRSGSALVMVDRLVLPSRGIGCRCTEGLSCVGNIELHDRTACAPEIPIAIRKGNGPVTDDAFSPDTEGPELDTNVPQSARVWNYWLGGKDNFAADREIGDLIRAANPHIAEIAVAQRAFLVRVVTYL